MMTIDGEILSQKQKPPYTSLDSSSMFILLTYWPKFIENKIKSIPDSGILFCKNKGKKNYEN